MNEQEQQLINRYLRYVRIRRIIIFSIVIVIFLIIIFIKSNVYNEMITSNVIIQEEITEIQDDVTNNIINSISINSNKIKEEKKEKITNEEKIVTKDSKKTNEIVETKKSIKVENTDVNKVKEKPANKDFLFIDGYNMENVIQVAQDYLKSSGCAGECVPLKDEDGIYIGMRVIFY